MLVVQKLASQQEDLYRRQKPAADFPTWPHKGGILALVAIVVIVILVSQNLYRMSIRQKPREVRSRFWGCYFQSV